jgi:hypothetical protein
MFSPLYPILKRQHRVSCYHGHLRYYPLLVEITATLCNAAYKGILAINERTPPLLRCATGKIALRSEPSNSDI